MYYKKKEREFRISGAEVRKVPESRKIEIEKDYRDRERVQLSLNAPERRERTAHRPGKRLARRGCRSASFFGACDIAIRSRLATVIRSSVTSANALTRVEVLHALTCSFGPPLSCSVRPSRGKRAGLRISCADAFMTDDLITLDRHRGMSAQKATEVRRLLAEVETNAKGLREQQEALEAQLILVPAASWPEAAEKARYLLGLFAGTPIAQDARRQKLIANVLEDFARLSRSTES